MRFEPLDIDVSYQILIAPSVSGKHKLLQGMRGDEAAAGPSEPLE
jgi:hypothetical protein